MSSSSLSSSLLLNQLRCRSIVGSLRRTINYRVGSAILAGQTQHTRLFHSSIQQLKANESSEDANTDEYLGSYNFEEEEILYGSDNLSEAPVTRATPESEDAFFKTKDNAVSSQRLDRMSDILTSVYNTTETPVATPTESYKLSRRFIPGTTYAPKDLDEETYRLYRERMKHAHRQDPFNLLGLNPLHEFKNIPLLSRFVTEMGRIRPRTETGLSVKNQRRLSKAIKRARAMGLMPFTYRPAFAFMHENRGVDATFSSRD